MTLKFGGGEGGPGINKHNAHACRQAGRISICSQTHSCILLRGHCLSGKYASSLALRFTSHDVVHVLSAMVLNSVQITSKQDMYMCMSESGDETRLHGDRQLATLLGCIA